MAELRGEKIYVQVTYLLAAEDTVNREFGAYDSIRDNFPKYVISLDEFDLVIPPWEPFCTERRKNFRRFIETRISSSQKDRQTTNA